MLIPFLKRPARLSPIHLKQQPPSNPPEGPFKLPLRFVLVVPFVLQISAAVGLTGYLSLRNGQKAIYDLTSQLRQEVSDRIDQHLDVYLDAPQQINKINANAVQLNLLDLKDFDKTGHYFWDQMQVFDVGYIYYVLPTGEYAGSGYFLDLENATIDELSARTTWKADTYATDSQGNRTDRVASFDDYNPLKEAAYTDAVAQKQPVWSQIYQWDNFPDIISISASYPLYTPAQELMGVLVTNLRLSQISEFLRQLHISPSGRTFILERNGLLVASSADEQPFKMVDGEAQRLQAIESQDPLIQATAQSLLQEFGTFDAIQSSQSLTFSSGGDRQFVQVNPWKDEMGLDWLIVVAVPEADFMAQINANTRTTILLCAAALVLALLLGLLTARWITRPILRLNEASQAIAQRARNTENGDELNQTIDVQNIAELDVLAQSFNQMAQQLQASFAALEETNSELEQRVEDRTAELLQTVTDLQRTQAQLVQTEKMSSLGQLVAGVAHEINNPVSFIYGNINHAQNYTQDLLELLKLYQTHYPQPHETIQDKIEEVELNFLQDDLPRIHASMQLGAERIQKIVLSLRNFSRMDEAALKAVDLHDGIESTLMILQSRLKAQPNQPEIQIVKDYGSLPLVECYAGQLNQVFMNLLTNAIDALEDAWAQRVSQSSLATPYSPTIHIHTATQPEQKTVTIKIADNGLGMPETVQTQLFNPFFTTKAIGKGTGLGLSISYQVVVEKHGGQLECQSAVGQGTEFIITLPIQAAIS